MKQKVWSGKRNPYTYVIQIRCILTVIVKCCVKVKTVLSHFCPYKTYFKCYVTNAKSRNFHLLKVDYCKLQQWFQSDNDVIWKRNGPRWLFESCSHLSFIKTLYSLNNCKSSAYFLERTFLQYDNKESDWISAVSWIGLARFVHKVQC